MENDLKLLREKEKKLVSSIKECIKKKDPKCEIVYLPNLTPKNRVDFIFVAMEPSFGTWAKTENEAQNKIDSGFRNFIDSWDVMAFHYCISSYLSTSYYITDISKAAMKVKNANKNRDWIFLKWKNLLVEEIDIIASNKCKLIPVGHKANDYISEHFSNYSVLDRILHYSCSAAKHRKNIPEAHPKYYCEYKNRLDQASFLQNVKNIIREHGIPGSTLKGIKKGLERNEPRITESRKQLMFSYYNVFNHYRIKEKEGN